MIDKLTNLFNRFQKVFWTVLSFELMERGAYYTMLPILAYHARFNLDLSWGLALTLPVFMYPFQYGLPIFTGAYAEKAGYRKQMIFAFSFLTVAYLFLSFAYDALTMIISVILIGIGIGAYKPLISATVAKCTLQKDRNVAYSIYYLVVNIAAAVFPIIWVILLGMGVMTEAQYAWVFRIGALFFLINIVVAVFVFEEVPRSGGVKTVSDVLTNIKIAFKDKKFLVMVILIGGFWALYSSFITILPLILFGYNLVPVWFSVMLLAVFNPLTIILAGPFLIKVGERIESMRLLIGGVLIYCIGLALIGLTLQWMFVIIGIILASIGEFMLAPGYLSFVSKLAPKEKVSSYIGCNFLSTMLGITMGTLVFGIVANYIAFDLHRPYFMYGILVSFGLTLLAAFIIYYRSWGQDVIARAKRIREEEEGIDEEYESAFKKEPVFFKIFDHRFSTIIPILLIPIILIATFSIGTLELPEDKEDVIEKLELIPLTLEEQASDYTNERQSTDIIFTISDKKLVEIECTLTWTDEGSQYPGGTNEPDEFKVSIIAPNGEIVDSDFSFTGTISASFDVNYTEKEYKDNYLGDWTIRVEAGECGDDSALIPIFGLRTSPDDGNSWSLVYSYTHMVPKEEEK